MVKMAFQQAVIHHVLQNHLQGVQGRIPACVWHQGARHPLDGLQGPLLRLQASLMP